MSPTPADATNKNKTKRSPPPLPQSLPLPTVSLPTHLRNALSLPPKWLALYDEYVTKNAGQISQMESALRSLTYIIPGRFRDAEIATEGIHSGVQLLSLYHDLLLFRASSSSSSSSSSLPAPSLVRSLHARYTRFWTARSTLYRHVAVVLQMVQYTELLLEMWAKRRGEAIRWRVVVLIEALKAVCRLLLLRITRSRPILTPALPERNKVPEVESEEEEEEEEEVVEEVEEKMLEQAKEEETTTDSAQLNTHTNGNGNGNGHTNGHAAPKPPSSSSPSSTTASRNNNKEWPMPRTGLTLPSLPSPGDISTYLLTRVLTADDLKPATKLLASLRGKSVGTSAAHTAEILHILAPLLYALALARTAPDRRRRSWLPWLVGLSTQLAARQLALRAARTGSRTVTALEKEEWARRGRAMWWWVMRGAAYEYCVKGVVGGVRRRVPGFVGTILEDYEYLWENYYFSTSDL